MQAADSWHYLAKQWLIVTDFPDGHSNNWRRATDPAIRFHLAENSTTAVFSFPTHSSRAFCCSSSLLSMQQIELQWAGKSCLDDALLNSPPSFHTALHFSPLQLPCNLMWGKGLKCKCWPQPVQSTCTQRWCSLMRGNPNPAQKSKPLQTNNSVQLLLT